MLVAEGEEELGSRHLPEFIKKYKDELKKADAVFFPFADQDQKGKVINYLGVKGIVYFELELDGKNWGQGPTEFDVHGSNKAWVDSPAWRMIQALSTMTTKDGNKVLIEDFYENALPPSQEDQDLLKKLEKTFDEDTIKELMKVEKFIGDAHGRKALLKYLYSPTLNVDGIWGGYTGPGTKTVLPYKITAKVDVRLVPDMTVEEVIPKVRKHLDNHGFKEIKVVELEEGYGWAKTSVREPAAQAIIKTYREFGYEPEVWPHMAGSAPFCMFNREPLNLPFVLGGLGHGGRVHAPNEYLVVQEGGPTGGLCTLEKSYVAILDNLSKMS
jgi:acetylornithine deacetylase/succinyl-diaminopimelate desuccinylase-like protein